MAVGCLIHLRPTGEIFHRQPFWPWPKPGVYPIQEPDGSWVQFFPCNYAKFKLGDKILPFPPVPYVPSSKESLK